MFEWLKKHKKLCFVIGGAILICAILLCIVFVKCEADDPDDDPPVEENPPVDDSPEEVTPTLTVSSKQLSISSTDTFTIDVLINAFGDVDYPAASMSIKFDPSRLEFIGIAEGNVFVKSDNEVGQKLPEWQCNAAVCNDSGKINVMYLDMTGGVNSFTKDLLAEDYNVVLRLSFRLRGSARVGDVYELTVEDAVFAASDETKSLAMIKDTLKIENGKITIEK